MSHGSFELVRWIIENRCDGICSQPGVDRVCHVCVKQAAEEIGDKDTFRIATWLIENEFVAVRDDSPSMLLVAGGLSSLVLAVLLKSGELVRWCDAKGFLTDAMIHKLVREATEDVNDASVEIVGYFLERGYKPTDLEDFVESLVRGSFSRNAEMLVELVLKSEVVKPLRHHFVYAATSAGDDKVLQWGMEYEHLQNRCLALARSASRLGHLSSMQWYFNTFGITKMEQPQGKVTELETLTIAKWLHETGCEAFHAAPVDHAAANGFVKVVRWLHETLGHSPTANAIDMAAGNGHLHVVEWIHENIIPSHCSSEAMNAAAWDGHLEVVNWLYENRDEGRVSVAMANAAANGRLDVVVWCLDHNACAYCVYKQLLQRPSAFSSDKRISKLSERLLYTLQWLSRVKNQRAIGCDDHCADYQPDVSSFNLAITAVSAGNIPLLEFLHAHHGELFTWTDDQLEDNDIDTAVQVMLRDGHLTSIQWLHAHYPVCLNWPQVAWSAEKKRLTAIATWLRAVEL